MNEKTENHFNSLFQNVSRIHAKHTPHPQKNTAVMPPGLACLMINLILNVRRKNVEIQEVSYSNFKMNFIILYKEQILFTYCNTGAIFAICFENFREPAATTFNQHAVLFLFGEVFLYSQEVLLIPL
jgi:hypothetical protein